MNVGLLVRVDAEPEYAGEVEAMPRGAQQLAEQEQGTVVWFAFRENATTFVVFDAFEHEQGRQAHLTGQVAAVLGEAAESKLIAPPVIAPVDLLGAKVSRTARGDGRPVRRAALRTAELGLLAVPLKHGT